MTDNEIIKALKNCHLTCGCSDCPYAEGYDDCVEKMRLDVLDLINRQRAEIDANEKIIKAGKESIKTYKSEVEKLVINVRTEAIKEVLDEITEILHEAEMHGNYEPSLTIEIINDIKKKMRVDNG